MELWAEWEAWLWRRSRDLEALAVAVLPVHAFISGVKYRREILAAMPYYEPERPEEH